MPTRNSRKILIIENEETVYDRIVQALEPKGFDVSVATTAEEGIAKAQEIIPDLIFIGIILPGLNGLKVSKSIHTVEQLAKVPVIIITTKDAVLDPKYTVPLGIVDIIVKPFRAEDVITKTVKVLGQDIILSKVEGDDDEVVLDEDEDVYSVKEEAFSRQSSGGVQMDSPKKKQMFSDSADSDDVTAGKSKDSQEEDLAAVWDETEKDNDDSPGPKTSEGLASSRDWDASGTDAEDMPETYEEKPAKKAPARIILLVAAFLVAAGAGGFVAWKMLYQKQSSVSESAAPVKQQTVAKEVITEKIPSDSKTVIPVTPAQEAPSQDKGQSAPAATGKEQKPAAETGKQEEGKQAPAKQETPKQAAASAPAPKPTEQKQEPAKKETAKQSAPSTAQDKTPAQKQEKQKPAEQKASAKTEKAASAAKTEKTDAAAYHVQMGVFKDEKNANSLSEKLKKKGYEVQIKKDSLQDKNVVYRVLVGKFKTRQEAADKAKDISGKEGLSAIIYPR